MISFRNRELLVKYTCYLLLVCMFFCCKYNKEQSLTEIFKTADPKDSLSFYFPPILNDDSNKKIRRPDFTNFEQNWYSSALYSLKEPILFKKSDSETIYRLLWLRSFHQPVSFTIKEFRGDYYLNTKMLDRQPAFHHDIEGGRTASGEIVLDTIKKADRLAFIIFNGIVKLNPGKWEEFERIIARHNFWNLPSPIPPDYSTDGSNWILEGYIAKKYHFIARRNFHEDIRDCANFLLDQTSLKMPKEAIY